MTWQTEERTTPDGLTEIVVWNDEDDPPDEHRAYLIDRESKVITFYPRDDFPVDEVVIEGYSSLPRSFNDKGYMTQGLLYYLNTRFSSLTIETLRIVRDSESSIRKLPRRDEFRIVLGGDDLESLRSGLAGISNEAREDRGALVDDTLESLFPGRLDLDAGGSASRKRARRVIRNLDRSIIDELSANDIEAFMDFLSELLERRYTSPAHRTRLFRAAKVKVDEVALQEVIDSYRKLIADDAAEAKLGAFLRKNLYLLDSNYVAVIPELNTALATTRKVDFGLVDSSGYLDLYEIKKCSTRLLSANEDRGNYYWHSDAVKALAQAEKYLYRAMAKANDLAADIRRERGLEVRVVKPKAVVVMGTRAQLPDEKRQEDFRILRESLKNIEVVLYDELLERLENQQGRLVGSAEIA